MEVLIFSVETSLVPEDNGKQKFHSFILTTHNEIVSHDAFFYALKNRNTDHLRLFTSRDVIQFKDHKAMIKRLGEKMPRLKNHKSIWDFYKHIGYDYKLKRFV